MITLLHGDDDVRSRDELTKRIDTAKNKDVRRLDGKILDEISLVQALESLALFGGDTLIIIENLLATIGKKSKATDKLTAILRSSDVDIVLWEPKEVGKTAIEALGKKGAVQLFKTPVIIFQFLDGLRPGNTRPSLLLFSECLISNPPEVIFTLLVRRVRQLIMVKDNVSPAGLADWQRTRLTSQAKLFTMEKLLAMYKDLADTEYRIKTGTTPFTFSQHLEQFLIDI